MTRLDELLAEATRLRGEFETAQQRLLEADQAVLVERFKDDEKFAEGDIVLVPRKLFGERKMWPARIAQVFLRYNSGTYRDGQPWESKSISYRVYLQAKDGTFSGAAKVFYHQDLEPYVAEEVA